MKIAPSPYLALNHIEYFQFEEDFVEENVRCIPMIVRFKMDEAGIKLRLMEWSKFSVDERVALAVMPCDTNETAGVYKEYLIGLIKKYTSNIPSEISPQSPAEWADIASVPQLLLNKLTELDMGITLHQWQALTDLQRFALLKLCKSSHENKNLPKALKEFGIV